MDTKKKIEEILAKDRYDLLKAQMKHLENNPLF
jgi:hypothetical protein